MNPKVVLGSISVIALPPCYALIGVDGVVLRDDLDLFGRLMSSPIDLLFPLVAVLLTCSRTFNELAHRFVANTRARIDVRKYIARRLAFVASLSFVTFFLAAFVPFLIAFYLWPAIGNPFVAPGDYNLTAGQAIVDSYSRHTYSFLLAAGKPVFGLGYSTLVGVAGVLFATFGLLMLILIRNRTVALAIPLVVFLLETIAAAIFNAPQFGFMYALFPFGLARSPLWQGALPILAFALALIGMWGYAFNRIRVLPNLA